jgi:catecholate siderophore receptor
MSQRKLSGPNRPNTPSLRTHPVIQPINIRPGLLPLGALLLAGSVTAVAQTEVLTGQEKSLPNVTVKAKAEAPEGKDSVRATQTSIGKGTQALRDIPQSLTVVTEKIIDDRNYDTLKDVLRNAGGISFLAAEGGEEDVRLRGFSLQGTGDVFVDGMRDPAFYERDTFNLDRVEVLRGSASMLFGRGSTGGAVNMVNKVPRLINEHQVDLTLGNHNYRRAVGDFNIATGQSSALRVGAMSTKADNNGSGSSIDKRGLAAIYRWGIGEKNEFSASLYHLENKNGMNYGLPWIRPTATSPASDTTTLPVDPKNYYGMASDRNHGKASYGTLGHTHRLDFNHEITTKLRVGAYERDQRASTIRLCTRTTNLTTGAVTNPQCPTSNSLANFGPNTILNRGTPLKIQDLDTVYLQSDYNGKFQALGFKHEVQAGVDFAQEEKVVYGARSAAQGGVVPIKPPTTVGTPNDGAWIDESTRVLRETSRYKSKGFGIYAQDLVQVAPNWKLLAGLRYDHLQGDYDTFVIPSNAPGPVTTTSYRMKVSEFSERLGVLYQPNELHSYHFSAATSFNTSGDAYSLSAANQDIPPEESINFELGAKLDSPNRQWTTRLALFHATKKNERNTDPLVNLVTLSGKRHVAGLEIEVSGRLTPQWEVFGSYVWMPEAEIDKGVAGSEGQGTRPSLIPVYSGTLWSTYQVNPAWRVGGGLNFRGKQTPNRNPGWEAQSFVTADLLVEYTYSKTVSFKANLSNVTNKLYADQLYTGHYIPGAGRLFQVTGSVKF